ncbi:unnamed protein product, partial [Prorocentrum cordatum]
MAQGVTGEEAARFIDDLRLADLVAVRLDTSGPPPPLADGLKSQGVPPAWRAQAHFSASAECLRRGPLPLRVGLCCCRRLPAEPGAGGAAVGAGAGTWELRAHELGLWPGAELQMPADVAARRRGAAREAAKAAGPAAAAPGAGASPWSSQLACPARWALAALSASRVPLAFHNGLPDNILELFDKFAGEVPAGLADFGSAWTALFPATFDVQLLASQAGPPAGPRAPLRLEELHEQLWSCAGNDVTFKELGLYTHRAASRRLGLVAGRGQGSVAREAMAVAESFIVQMRLRLHATSGASQSLAGVAVLAPSAIGLCGGTAAVADALKKTAEGANQPAAAKQTPSACVPSTTAPASSSASLEDACVGTTVAGEDNAQQEDCHATCGCFVAQLLAATRAERPRAPSAKACPAPSTPAKRRRQGSPRPSTGLGQDRARDLSPIKGADAKRPRRRASAAGKAAAPGPLFEAAAVQPTVAALAAKLATPGGLDESLRACQHLHNCLAAPPAERGLALAPRARRRASLPP